MGIIRMVNLMEREIMNGQVDSIIVVYGKMV
jgi:hypothetical protein